MTLYAIGTGVFGGVLSATVLAIFFVPLFFMVVFKLSEKLTGTNRRGKGRGAIEDGATAKPEGEQVLGH